MIYLFLLENKPFKKENIESYMKPEEKKSPKSPKSPKKMIASPSKNTNFSPYKKFAKRRSVVLGKDTMDNLHKMIESPKAKNSPNIKSFKRRKSVERKVTFTEFKEEHVLYTVKEYKEEIVPFFLD